MPQRIARSRGRQPRAWFAVLGAAALANCGTTAGEPPAPPPPQVSVVELRAEDVLLTIELPGRTAPFMVAEVRPQVGGLIQARPFREGSDVRAGDLLYQIEPATFRANVAIAEAALGNAEASLVAARLKAERYRGLSAMQAVSAQDADDAAAESLQGQAAVASARAVLANERIRLAWTRVTAPISGRIGTSTVTQGALVIADQPTALATIQRLDPIYVDLTQSSDDLMRLKRALAAGTLTSSGVGSAKVSLLLKDGTHYPHQGTLQFSDVTVDEGTSAVTLRAVFPNPKGELLPGLYVRAVIEEGIKRDALLVPQPAVSRNEAGKPIAYVVSADNKLEQRAVVTERAVGTEWLISSGLKVGDRLVVEGLQNARAGVIVSIVSAGAANGAAAGSAPLAAPPAKN